MAENAFIERLKGLADGDLGVRVGEEVAAAFPEVKDAFNTTMDRLQNLVRDIQVSCHAMVDSAEIISRGSQELSPSF